MRDIIGKVLDLARRRADAAEVVSYDGEQVPVEFKSNKLHSVEHKEVKGVGLRVIKDGRIGFSSTTDLDKLDDLVAHAAASAQFGQKASFELPASCQPRKVRTVDTGIMKLTVDKAIDEGKKALAALREKAPALKCDISISKRSFRTELGNSRGLYQAYDKTSFSYYITGLAVKGGHMLYVGDGRTSGRLRLDTGALVRKIAGLYDRAQKASPLATGQYPVLFSHDAIYLFWMALESGINGKMVQKKFSPLIGRTEEQILDKRISLADDPLADLAWHSAPCDDEGTACKRLPLFERGVLKNFIYDLQTAGILGVTSTGHGWRNQYSQPAPATTNLMIAPGTTPLKEMIKSIDRGVIIHDLLGAGQSNLLAGDFSANIELGFLVEKGKIAGRVKDVMVAGNVYDLLKSKVLAVSKEIEEKGNTFTPAVLFKDVSIAAK